MISGTIARKYHAFAGQAVAVVECGPQGCGSGLKYFLTDHLGSVAAVVNASGGLVSRHPWASAEDKYHYPFCSTNTENHPGKNPKKVPSIP